MKYFIESWIGNTKLVVEDEGVTLDSIIKDVQRVDAAAKAALIDRAKDDINTPVSVGPTPFALSGLPIVADPAVPKGEVRLVSGSETVVFEAPTVDAVADAVKLIVAKHGVPRAALLLKEHGGARAADVPAENRSAFIEAAQKAVAA